MGSAEDFKQLLAIGIFQSYDNCLYLCGACKVGKSTFASVLLDEEIPKTWISTDGLNIYFGRNGIHLTDLKMVPLKEGKLLKKVCSRNKYIVFPWREFIYGHCVK